MNPGTLFLVPTPIGNLKDITLRALEVLQAADLIAAEDTRTTRKLLSHYDIHTPLISFHRHSGAGRLQELLKRLQAGTAIAVVSEAGTPGISDPGADLARAAIAAGLPVQVLPGPSAVLPALVLSGLDTDRFAFEGFLPRQGRARRERLAELAGAPHTLILFEAPHRLVETLHDLEKALGNRRAAAVRELTKRFEEVARGTLAELQAHFQAQGVRGEFTLVVEGAPVQSPAHEETPDLPDPAQLAHEVEEEQARGASRADALRAVAQRHSISRKELYRRLLEG